MNLRSNQIHQLEKAIKKIEDVQDIIMQIIKRTSPSAELDKLKSIYNTQEIARVQLKNHSTAKWLSRSLNAAIKETNDFLESLNQ